MQLCATQAMSSLGKEKSLTLEVRFVAWLQVINHIYKDMLPLPVHSTVATAQDTDSIDETDNYDDQG